MMILFVLNVLLVVAVSLGFLFGLAMVFAVLKHSKPKHVDIQELKALHVPRDSLFRLFQPYLIPIEEISARGYSAVLAVVQHCIGVQPTCDTVLEIWKPAFECYNIIVPNFLNIPELLLPGYGDLRELVSLAMYVSSRANSCAYCTSHCCSFAMRRGVDPTTLRSAMDVLSLTKRNGSNDSHGDGDADNKTFNLKEQAVIRVAYGLGTVPACLNKEDVTLLQQAFPSRPDQQEWIVAATAMFGAFNKYMDGLAIPLERDTYKETVQNMDPAFVPSNAATFAVHNGDQDENTLAPAPLPPTDDWTMQLAVIYHGLRPGGAAALDRQLTRGIPSKADECVALLQASTGATFSVLQKLQHARLRRVLTAIIRKNFVTDGVSLRTKVLAGIHYCDQHLRNTQLKSELQQVLTYIKEQNGNGGDDDDDDKSQLLLKAANALSYNPSRMTANLIDEIEGSASVTVENMVEMVSFLATLQALHRLKVYYHTKEEGDI